MFTMYHVLATLTKGEVISATSTGRIHPEARAEIMRFINYKEYPRTIFTDDIIKASENATLSTLSGDNAKNFNTHWNNIYAEMSPGQNPESAASEPSNARIQRINLIVRNHIETLELPVMASVEKQRAEARERVAQKKIAAQNEAYEREIIYENSKFAEQLTARRDAIEETARQLSAKQAALNAFRNAEKETAKKLAEAEKIAPCVLPDLNAVSGKGWRELEAFVKRVGDLKAQGATLSKKDQELCRLVSESIVAPFKLGKSGDPKFTSGKPSGRIPS